MSKVRCRCRTYPTPLYRAHAGRPSPLLQLPRLPQNRSGHGSQRLSTADMNVSLLWSVSTRITTVSHDAAHIAAESDKLSELGGEDVSRETPLVAYK